MNNREIYEGWNIQDFIDHLEPMFDMIMDDKSWRKPFKMKLEIKEWCKDNQPYYKKSIKEVNDYFIKRAGL